MSPNIALLYTTFSNKEQAKALIRPLVEKGMIACANLFAMESIYSWQDEVNCDTELVAILKTAPEKVNLLIDFLKANHPYETPCILNWEVDGNKEYTNWVMQQTSV